MSKFKITFPEVYDNYCKIPVIKTLRELIGCGLKEAKDMSETTSAYIMVDTNSLKNKNHMHTLVECGCRIDEISDEIVSESSYVDDLRDIALKALKNKDDAIAITILQFMYTLVK